MPGRVVIESSGEHGIDPDRVEAAACAWLAKLTPEGKPGNIPGVTGAHQAVTPGRHFRHP